MARREIGPTPTAAGPASGFPARFVRCWSGAGAVPRRFGAAAWRGASCKGRRDGVGRAGRAVLEILGVSLEDPQFGHDHGAELPQGFVFLIADEFA